MDANDNLLNFEPDQPWDRNTLLSTLACTFDVEYTTSKDKDCDDINLRQNDITKDKSHEDFSLKSGHYDKDIPSLPETKFEESSSTSEKSYASISKAT